MSNIEVEDALNRIKIQENKMSIKLTNEGSDTNIPLCGIEARGNNQVLITGTRIHPTFIDVLRLHITQDYNGGYHCTDDNYDGAPDAGQQTMGHGKTPSEALADYFEYAAGFELLDVNTNYIISGKDLIC